MQTITRVLFLLCVVALVKGGHVSIGARMADCDQFHLPICTREYEPVCGDDGETYTNECMLCLKYSESNRQPGVIRAGPC